MTKIELTNPEEIEQFKAFRKHQSEIENITAAWKQVMDFTVKMGSGSYTLVVQNGLPVRIDNPMQKIIIGIKL